MKPKCFRWNVYCVDFVVPDQSSDWFEFSCRLLAYVLSLCDFQRICQRRRGTNNARCRSALKFIGSLSRVPSHLRRPTTTRMVAPSIKPSDSRFVARREPTGARNDKRRIVDAEAIYGRRNLIE